MIVSRLSLLAIALVACGSDETFMIVTIDSVPAVHDVDKIQVDLDNDGQTRGDSFGTNNLSFPATFSISAPGRTGGLAITVSAFDEDGVLVGRGTTSTTIEQPTAAVTLDSADFVVNTDFAGDQFPSNDFESDGFQIGAAPDGTWTAVYRDSCPAPCNMFARRFDVTGKPAVSALAAGTNGFAVSTELTDGFFSTPTTASNGNATIVVWNFSEPPPGTTSGIACRALDSTGNAVADQVTISTETVFPFAVSATPLGASSFVLAWNSSETDNITRSTIVNANCQPGGLATISTVVTDNGATRPSVVANGNKILYSWTNGTNARYRVTTDANTAVTADLALAVANANEEVRFTRAVKMGTGFGIFVRWISTANMGPSKIELYKINENGQVQPPPILITNKTGSDFDSARGFSATTRADDGTVLVAWHSCMDATDGSGCGVFGRTVGSNGQPIGEEFSLATTLEGSQSQPSVIGLPGAFAAVWKDESLQEPDVAGSAVRGRVLYPPVGSSASAKPGEPRTVFPTIEWDHPASSSAR